MPLHSPAPPQQATDAVHSRFQAFAQKGFRSPALRAADPAQLTLTQPHQVFVLGADDLVAGRGLEAAKPSRWRYLVQARDKIIAAASVIPTGTGDVHAFSHISEGPFVASTAEALEFVRLHPELTAGDFELRLLQVPALHTMAVWLHPQAGKGDLLLPLAPSPVSVRRGQSIPAAQLLSELAEKARQVVNVGANDTRGG
ncbi:MAG: hypothetical protein JSR62_16425 [Nitrospira sp.]|nr:hypothetical protein [Nitrospira sp.]